MTDKLASNDKPIIESCALAFITNAGPIYASQMPYLIPVPIVIPPYV